MQRSVGHGSVARWAVRAAAAAIVALGLQAQHLGARAESGRGGTGAMSRNLMPPKKLVGDWLAVTETDAGPQQVRLTIHTMEPGKTAGKLAYSSPKRCFVDLQYGGPDGESHVFRIVPFTNCFQYQSTDVFVLRGAQALPRAFSDLSRAAPAYGLMPKDRKADAGTALSDAGSGAGISPAAKPMVARMQYAISLDNQVIETGLLARQ